jgi:hypothetical protein
MMMKVIEITSTQEPRVLWAGCPTGLKGKSRERHVERGRRSGWYHGESSSGRIRTSKCASPPPGVAAHLHMREEP